MHTYASCLRICTSAGECSLQLRDDAAHEDVVQMPHDSIPVAVNS